MTQGAIHVTLSPYDNFYNIMSPNKQKVVSIPSPCASMIAFCNLVTLTIHIRPIESRNSQQELTADILGDLERYTSVREGNTLTNPSPKITQLEWEHCLPDTKASKIGVLIETYAILLVYDIREQSLPIIIRQARVDGLCKFQWIPPVIDEAPEGAYVNCKQLVLFTDNYLHAKLYSLDCTTILWTIETPVPNSGIIVKPCLKNRIWTLVGEQILTTSLPPVVYLFFNFGSESKLFHTFELTDEESTTRLCPPELNWSQSGNWLLDFSTHECLFGFCMDLYNSLGVGTTAQNIHSGVEIRKGTPVATLNWLTDGIHHVTRGATKSLVTYGALNYLSLWVKLANSEVVVIASLLDKQIELLCYSVMKLRLTKVAFLTTSIRYVWQQHGSTFRKVITKGVQVEDLNAIKTLDHCLSITCNNTIFVYVVSETETVQFDHKSTLKFAEPIDAVIHLKDSAKNAMIVVAGQYVIAYLVERDSVQVLFESSIIHDALVYEQDNKCIILIKVANEGLKSDWYSMNISYEELLRDEPTITSVKHRPSSEFARDSRSRWQRLHLPSITNDDITDTFGLKSHT